MGLAVKLLEVGHTIAIAVYSRRRGRGRSVEERTYKYYGAPKVRAQSKHSRPLLCAGVRCRFAKLASCAAEVWRSFNAAHRRHLSAIRIHTILFSEMWVDLAISSHST